jgi:uncharacterized membrane protein YheB (UPF0754 family)
MSWSLLLLPPVGAAIGWGTNYLAIVMLFRPKAPLRLLGFTFQGLIPRRRRELAENVAEGVARELLGSEDVAGALESEAFRVQLAKVLDQRLARVLAEKLAARPLIGQFLTEDVLAPIRQAVIREVVNAFPAVASVLREALTEGLDVRGIVLEKLEQLDVDALEALVYRVARQEFRYIEVVGGVIGFLVGLVQVGVALLLG